jgi:hypothetical protein
MKPVMQTRYGWPHGNCYAACVASLMELPIEDMPVIPADGNFNELWDAWLAERGFARICFRHAPDLIVKGYQILCGKSPRDVRNEKGERVDHATVGLDGKFVHDPNPEGTFLLDGVVDEVEIIYPLDIGGILGF